MNLRERLAAIDPTKTDKWQNGFWDFEDIGTEVGIYNLYSVDGDKFDVIKEFRLHTWICTDTTVGYHALFLNGEFICMTVQHGRKCDKHYFWNSKEAFEKTRQYLISAIPEREVGCTLMTEKDWDFDPENPPSA